MGEGAAALGVADVDVLGAEVAEEVDAGHVGELDVFYENADSKRGHEYGC